MISTPSELGRYLLRNREATGQLVQGLVDDIKGATDAIMEILDEGYDKTKGMIDIMGWELSYEDYLAQPMIEPGTDWHLPLSDGDYWDGPYFLLHENGVSEELIVDYQHRLVLEVVKLVERSGKDTPESGLVDIFGKKALEAFQNREEANEPRDHRQVIVTAAELIAEWIAEIVPPEGEALALYAALGLLTENR